MAQTKTAENAAGTNLTENDVLYRARPHLLALLWPFALFAAASALALLAERHLPGLGVRIGFRADQAASLEAACRWLLLAVTLIFAMNAVATLVECRVTTYVVTPTRVVASSALVRASSATVYLAKVEAVLRDQGPLERMFDVGTVTLVGTGGHRDTVTNVREFARFMSALEGAIPARHEAR